MSQLRLPGSKLICAQGLDREDYNVPEVMLTGRCERFVLIQRKDRPLDDFELFVDG